MGVIPPNNEAQPRTTLASRDGASTPEPETRSKFEEALRRSKEGGAHDPELLGDAEPLAFDPPFVQRGPIATGDDRNGSDDLVPAVPGSPLASPHGGEEAAISGEAADLPLSHFEFVNRVNLPTQGAAAESQLTMTDQRWLAASAIIRRDDAGGLLVEIQTRSDAQGEQQQRQALRSRLEARGHRITSIRFD